MPTLLTNPWRCTGLPLDCPLPIAEAGAVSRMLADCPAHAPTPLTDSPALASLAGVRRVLIKDERGRMGLGSFKALGAAHAIAREAAAARPESWDQALTGRTFVTASAGNHGLSVAAGARIFGARAVIYIADTVPEAFASRLARTGAEVVRVGANYEASMEAAQARATHEGWTLLSDSSWTGYVDLPLRVMEGYLQLAAEAADQIGEAPSHILLQAGVGGLAGAIAAHARAVWGDVPQIIVVEPAAAPALVESIRAGKIVTADGPVSAMGRLDCKTPSIIALAGLSRDADGFATITEAEAEKGIAILADQGFDTTPSGGAGLAALLSGLSLGSDATVLTYLTEGPEDA